jgi:mono/diheme cytochrome c family protein
MTKRAILLLASLGAAPAFGTGPEILQKRCLSCHNAQARMGGLSLETKADAAAVLGGRLWARVQAGQMPPGGGLPPAERAELGKWLESGAVWEGRLATRQRAGKDWWSFQPLKPASGSIDSFLLARLRQKGLGFSPEASRQTLIRRVTFDLTGLPPSPEEVAAFVANGDYEALVDRLLASPAYGERWGRHWMDVIRYGESNGYEQNHARPSAWPFRDYLIRSFNADVPFNRMILEHLAGDLTGKGNPDVEVATAFLVAGPHDTVGNQAEAFKRQQRADDYDDMVNATAAAFLGLTVNCAKCHDHKFDPILQSDYYRMAAVFAGVHHGEREMGTPAQKEAYRAAAAPLEARIAAGKKRLEELRPKDGLEAAADQVRRRMRPPVSPFFTEERFPPIRARMVRVTFPQGAAGGLDELEIWNTAGRNVALGRPAAASATRVADGNPDAYHPRSLTDGVFDKRWFAPPGANGATVTVDLGAVEEIGRVSWSTDRKKAFQGRFQQAVAARYTLAVSGDGVAWKDVASEAGRLPARKEDQERLFALEALSEPARQEYLAAEKELAAATRQLAAIEKLPRAYAGEFRPAEPVYLLKGGNVMQRGPAMEPGSLSALPGFTLALDAPEGERRLALAKWIGSDTNPLTPRVIANRLWHYHFGRGLVGTPSDFGFNGERPSHPELLDALAAKLVGYGWRLKPLHREILLSAAYRQGSGWQEAAAKVDAEARLLWRFPPQRLQAEAIRDSMLAVAGVLDRRMGGPGFPLYKYTVDNVATYFPLESFGPETYRRSVYAQSARSIRTELLSVYDCPDSSLPEPRRVVTTSPLQALSLLNNSFTLDMARAFAARMAEGPDAVGRGFQLAFGRSPVPAERAGAEELVARHGLAALARALFNANEFVYVH